MTQVSESTAPLVLADKARRLAALARAKSENEGANQDQVRLQGQLAKLTGELATLEAVLATHRQLNAAGVPVAELPDLTVAVRELRDQVSRIGRPTWQYMMGRVKSVTRSHEDISEADAAAWRTWAQAQVDALPLALVPRLGFERGATEQRVKRLRALGIDPPRVGAIGEFKTLLGRVREDLERFEGSDVDSVLQRFAQGRVLLANLSDEDLALLRSEPALRDQLYLALS